MRYEAHPELVSRLRREALEIQDTLPYVTDLLNIAADFIVGVAVLDGKPGCPVERWDDGPVPFRCSCGIDECYRHGKFEIRPASHSAGEGGITTEGDSE